MKRKPRHDRYQQGAKAENAIAAPKATLEQLFEKFQAGEVRELPL